MVIKLISKYILKIQFQYLDERRRQKAITILLETITVPSTSTINNNKQTKMTTSIKQKYPSLETKDDEKEDVIKPKLSQLPLMSQV